jgi:internalin A
MLPSEVYEIPDPDFKNIILKSLGKLDDKLTPEDMEKISSKTDLHISGKNIKSIEGIQNFKSLSSLHITGTQITDLTPLESLSNLKFLLFWKKALTDFPRFPDPGNLEMLGLSHAKIRDFSQLPGLSNPRILQIATDHDVNISSLSRFKNLFSLMITFKEMDIFDIPSDDDINSAVPLDLNCISMMNELEMMVIRYPKLINYDSLAELKKMRVLILASCDSIDFTFVSKLKNLEIIELSNSTISDLKFLSGLDKLETVTIKRNSLKDISPLLNLKNLRRATVAINEDKDNFVHSQLKVLNSRGIIATSHFLDSECTMMLKILAISQNLYRDNNPDRNFGTLDELFNTRFLKKKISPEAFTADYRLVKFQVTLSEKNANGEITKEASFMIVAEPKVPSRELKIFAIDESQKLRTWIGDDSEWDIDNIILNNPKQWEYKI